MGWASNAWDTAKSVASPVTDDRVQSFLFGEEKTANTKKTPRLTQSQMDLLKSLSSTVAGEVGEGVEPYPGDLVAGESGLQSDLFSVLDQSMAQGGGGGSLQELLQQGGQMLNQEGEYDQGAARDYWQQSFVKPARQQFQEETMPELREEFAGQNALDSGGFNRAVADAAGEMNTQLGGKLGEILYQDRQDFQDRQMQEQQLGLSTLDQALQEVDALMQAGREQRGIDQQSLEGQFQKWQQSQDYNNPWLKQAPTALGVSPYQIDTYTKGGGSGVVGGMLEGGAQGAGSALTSYAMSASDERLKTEITQTGDEVLGVPLVRFKWNNDLMPEADAGEHIGVLAQDLQKVKPEMVGERPDGYLTVDYGQLLEEAENGSY